LNYKTFRVTRLAKVVLLVTLFVTAIQFLSVKSSNAASDSGYTLLIPGIPGDTKNYSTTKFYDGTECSDMIPQGICFADNYVIYSGYDSQRNFNSVLWIIELKTGNLLATIDLTEKVHAGGICYSNGFLWVSSLKNYIRYIRFSDVIKQINKGYTSFSLNIPYEDTGTTCVPGIESGVFKLGSDESASSVTYYKNYLYIVEFSDGVSPPNPKLRQYKVSFNQNTKSKDGTPLLGAPKSIKQVKTYSVPSKVQGIQIVKLNGKVYVLLSRSYGRKKSDVSEIQLYQMEDSLIYIKTYDLRSNPLYPMIEGIAISGKYLYAVSESGAQYYKNDKKNPSDNPQTKAKCILVSDIMK